MYAIAGEVWVTFRPANGGGCARNSYRANDGPALFMAGLFRPRGSGRLMDTEPISFRMNFTRPMLTEHVGRVHLVDFHTFPVAAGQEVGLDLAIALPLPWFKDRCKKG